MADSDSIWATMAVCSTRGGRVTKKFLIQSISMTSEELELDGTGSCGKGYKEFVKISTGGPYIKAKGRLA